MPSFSDSKMVDTCKMKVLRSMQLVYSSNVTASSWWSVACLGSPLMVRSNVPQSFQSLLFWAGLGLVALILFMFSPEPDLSPIDLQRLTLTKQQLIPLVSFYLLMVLLLLRCGRL